MGVSDGFARLMSVAVGVAALAVAGALVLAHPDELGAVAAAVMPEHRAIEPSPDLESDFGPRAAGPRVELQAGPGGHYHAEVEINGRSVPIVVDTGATMVALSFEDAERAGVRVARSDFKHGASTANGIARVAKITLSRVSVGDITLRNVQASISEPGRLETSLLGMSFLGRLSRLDIRDGTLILEE